MRVRFSRRADVDLAAIQTFIAQDNPSVADKFAHEFAVESIAIAATPFGFPLIPQRNDGLRRKVFKSYLIIYNVHADQVEIVRIDHGARDYPALLGGDA